MILNLLISAFSLLFLSNCTVFAQYPDPITFTGPAAVNVANTLNYQDISIIQRVSDQTYFRISKSNATGLGLSVATAPAFRGPWTYSYEALAGPLKDSVASNRSAIRLWAPEIHYINSTYYLYYGINYPEHGHGLFDIAVATSADLTPNSWTDHGSVNIPVAPHASTPEREYVRLGVNLLANSSDPSGIDLDYKHLTFGSFNHGLYGVNLTDDLLEADRGDAVEVLADQYNPGNRKLQGNKTEGSYQLHHEDYIYYFYSIGSCCASSGHPESVYRVEVCRGNYADGPSGPFFDRDGINCLTGPVNRTGTVVIASHGGTGHEYAVYAPGSIGIFRDDLEGLVMYYQFKNLTASDKSLRFGFNYLGFDGKGWPVLSNTKTTANA